MTFISALPPPPPKKKGGGKLQKQFEQPKNPVFKTWSKVLDGFEHTSHWIADISPEGRIMRHQREARVKPCSCMMGRAHERGGGGEWPKAN